MKRNVIPPWHIVWTLASLQLPYVEQVLVEASMATRGQMRILLPWLRLFIRQSRSRIRVQVHCPAIATDRRSLHFSSDNCLISCSAILAYFLAMYIAWGCSAAGKLPPLIQYGRRWHICAASRWTFVLSGRRSWRLTRLELHIGETDVETVISSRRSLQVFHLCYAW